VVEAARQGQRRVRGVRGGARVVMRFDLAVKHSANHREFRANNCAEGCVARTRWTRSIFGLLPESERSWRRRTQIVIAWLCVGAVVNVLVAWGCVWYGETRGQAKPTHQHGPVGNTWPFAVRATSAAPECVIQHRSIGYRCTEAQGILVTWESGDSKHWCPDEFFSDMMASFYAGFPLTEYHHVRLARAGWPLQSVRARIHLQTSHWSQHGESLDLVGVNPYEDSIWKPTAAKMLVGGVPVHRWITTSAGRGQDWTLPIRPLPLAFALNSAFYGAAAMLACLGVGRLISARARRRRRFGLCLRCGYDNRGLERCPECGTVCERALAERTGR
jgi:hypothetical protein